MTIQPLPRELARYWGEPDIHGVLVGSVAHGSPAEAAGIAVGDVIMSFDGDALRAEKDEDLGQFQRLVALKSVGKDVSIELMRGGERRTLRAALGAQPKYVPDEEESSHGFTVEEVTEASFRGQRLPQREGVLVSFVEPGSEAAEAGMQRGDMIVEIEKAQIATLDDFRHALGTKREQPFLVRALRGDDTRFLLVNPRAKVEPPAASSSSNPR